MRFMTLTLERIYMSGFLSISFKYEIDIFPIQSINSARNVYQTYLCVKFLIKINNFILRKKPNRCHYNIFLKILLPGKPL